MPYLLADLELDELEWLSSVDAGAGGDENHRPAIMLIKSKTKAKGSHETSLKVPIVKLDKPERVLYGLASIVTGDDGQPLIDHDEDVIRATDLEKAVHKAAVFGGAGKGGDMHAFQGVGDIVESAVITQEKREAFKGFLGDSKAEGWMVGFKVRDDETWQRVVSGERPEFSIKIHARRVPLDDVGILEKIKRLLAGVGRKAPKEKQMPEDNAAPMAPADPNADALAAAFDEVMAGLSEAQQKVIFARLEAARKMPAPESEEDAPAEGDAEMSDEMQKARDEKVALEKRVADLEKRERTMVAIEKARTEMPNVPGSPPEVLGPMLAEAKAYMEAQAYDALCKALKSASQVVAKTDLFNEQGTGGDDGLDDDEAELKAKIEEKMETDKKLTPFLAKRAVFNEHPDLYAKILAKQH